MERRPFRAPMLAPQDRRRFWFWDPSHFPAPVTPACETFDVPTMQAGFTTAAAMLSRPLAGQHVRVFRGYVYFGLDVPASAEALAAGEASYRVTVDPLLDSALDRWTKTYAPQAQSLTDKMLSIVSSPSEDADYASALDQALTLRGHQWQIHDLALVPAMEAAARFTARYAERLGGAAAAQTLLQGFPNRQTEAAEALEALAEGVRSRPGLAQRLLAHADGEQGSPPDDVGRWFAGALREFLDQYGRRAAGWDVGAATWQEDPSPVFALIRERLRRPPSEPGRQRRRAEEHREAAVAAALGRLPDGERPEFLAMLRAAQAYPVVSEDHNALIDQQGMAALRAVILEAGRRLVARECLRSADDAVWLSRDELAESLRTPRDLRRLAGYRRALRDRRARLTSPRTLGSPLPTWAANNPTLGDFFGLGAEAGVAGEELRGVGVSPGAVEGRACVVHGLDELDRLEAGDILVCHMTSPAWTPWLALIAGAVVETGGMLSHTAILTREYGVPCVVNVRDAVARIPHGARIRVDGSAGSVRLLD